MASVSTTTGLQPNNVELVNSAGRRKRRAPQQRRRQSHQQQRTASTSTRYPPALANSRSSRSPAAPPSTPSRLSDGAFADPLHLHCWYPCARSTTTIVNIISSINPSPLGEPSRPLAAAAVVILPTATGHVGGEAAAAGDAGDTNDGNNNDNNINSVNDDGNSDNDGWNQHPLERSPMIGAHASPGAVETIMVMINSIMGRDSRRSLLHIIVKKRPIGWLLSLFPFPTAESCIHSCTHPGSSGTDRGAATTHTAVLSTQEQIRISWTSCTESMHSA
ncbi:hypothetical protein PTSG_10204 [Salpingoeca rosetta]|uniref:Uncharacterized protein n=1 Tax=Salpingoeca rosetta (strain ATCC 50818 / BSB-021) TaxID=946362 RepID=F2UQL7_SALR5|nr:uncharacterized protein PTSG_10204 [Salpingoeca rosetta]EGD79922.1 hypothetical protein PTSG_10204 [Salpingoeca rosetta]|eukprot:XP_004988543.1 hypothetical protein PTSG_10204 [Salpingoeca rosetta]